jgi:hypothetical protein
MTFIKRSGYDVDATAAADTITELIQLAGGDLRSERS